MTATHVEASAIAREGLASIEHHCFYANHVIPQLKPDAPCWFVDLAGDVHNLVALSEALNAHTADRWCHALEMEPAYRRTRTAIVNEALRRNRASR